MRSECPPITAPHTTITSSWKGTDRKVKQESKDIAFLVNNNYHYLV